MKRTSLSKRFWLLWIPGSITFILGGCNALSDSQLTSVAQSAVSTGLNALVTNVISAFFSGVTGA